MAELDEKFPAGQFVHDAAPDEDAYVPGEHAWHTLIPVDAA